VVDLMEEKLQRILDSMVAELTTLRNNDTRKFLDIEKLKEDILNINTRLGSFILSLNIGKTIDLFVSKKVDELKKELKKETLKDLEEYIKIKDKFKEFEVNEKNRENTFKRNEDYTEKKITSFSKKIKSIEESVGELICDKNANNIYFIVKELEERIEIYDKKYIKQTELLDCIQKLISMIESKS
jgi:hypothetical protein